MTAEVLILGGYGNFGKRIAAGLARHGVATIIAGRDGAKAEALAADLPGARGLAVDIGRGLDAVLRRERPVAVIHTCGPFQGAGYDVARACIAAGAHYIDLADGRDFVAGFGVLDEAAKAAGVALVTGASTVPGLSSAVIEHYWPHFARLDSIDYGITPGARTERGLATVQAILSYVGQPLKPWAGHERAWGWQDMKPHDYPVFGRRWQATCEIPDMDLLPERYGLRSLTFRAGVELGFLQWMLWGLSWPVRRGWPVDLKRFAPLFLEASRWFDGLGGDVGGMHVVLDGEGVDGRPLRKTWYIIAEKGDGPNIPCIPAIVLARKMATGARFEPGARVCVGLVSLEDYLAELAPFAVTTIAP